MKRLIHHPSIRRPALFGLTLATALTLAACEPADPAVTDPATTPPATTAPPATTPPATTPAAPGATAPATTPAAPDAAAPGAQPAAPAAQAGVMTEQDAVEVRNQLDEVTVRLNAVEERLATMAETAETENLANEARQDVDEAMTLLAEVRQRIDGAATMNGAAAPATVQQETQTVPADADALDDEDADEAPAGN
jgi:hypothetical protein